MKYGQQIGTSNGLGRSAARPGVVSMILDRSVVLVLEFGRVACVDGWAVPVEVIKGEVQVCFRARSVATDSHQSDSLSAAWQERARSSVAHGSRGLGSP